jgi:cytochrome c556
MKLRFKILALSAALASASSVALADQIDDAIDARRGFYQVVKHMAGGLFAMAKGEVDYNAEQAATYAMNLDQLANMDTGTMWLPGSSNADRPGKTRALPVIWSTYPAIGEKSVAWKAATGKLAASAGNGLDALRADIGALGASCKGCHDTYRAKDF